MVLPYLWHEAVDPDTTLEVYRKLALLHVDRIHNPVCRDELRRAVKRRQWERVCSYDVPLNGTVSTADVIEIRQVLAFFQKLESLDLGIDKEAAAMQKFVESERSCAETNRFFWHLNNPRRATLSPDPYLARVLYRAKEKVARVLRQKPPAVAEWRMRFGPGATTATKKAEACAVNKLSAGLGCSSRMLHSLVLRNILRDVPHWTAEFATDYTVDEEGYLVEWVEVTEEVARLAFVPKNWKTHRGTVTEPSLNSFAQLGIGDWMVQRLKQFGVDLTDQTHNQRLAREGSLTGCLATIDLSSASDTIARELVKFLLPNEWYALLNSLRSDEVYYKGRGGGVTLFKLEKFSSMGNGFTFPLESLIFWSIVSSIKPEGVCSVYGDDIICDSDIYEDASRVLGACGFSVNQEKSFASGPFRESCGHDYLLGIQTRPCYMKEDASQRSLYRLHNYYVSQLDPDMARAVLKVLKGTNVLWGPNEYGDGHLHDPMYWDGRGLSARAAKLRKEKGFCGDTFESYRLRNRRSKAKRFAGDHISPLYHTYILGGDDVPLFDMHVETDEARRELLDRLRSPEWRRIRPDAVRKDDDGYPLWVTPGWDETGVVRIYAFRR